MCWDVKTTHSLTRTVVLIFPNVCGLCQLFLSLLNLALPSWIHSFPPLFALVSERNSGRQKEIVCVIYIRVELKLVCIPLGTKWALELEVSWFSQWVLWWYPRFNSLCSFVSLWMNLQQHQNVNCWSHAIPGKVFHFYHWTQQQIQININQDF